LGGNAQTIWPALLSRRYVGEAPRYQRERWILPDGDFIDVDRVPAATKDAPLLVLFHGLEGSSASHYSQAFAHLARERGWHYAVPHFRGCSGEMNLAPRAYHSGDYEEVGWMLQRFRRAHIGPMLVAGISLGGNAMLRWAEESGDTARPVARAIAAISAPLDLAASGRAIGIGFNRLTYTRMFLRTMRRKALQKLEQYPGLFDRDKMIRISDLYAFDNLFTAPVHGFRDTDDYWQRASSISQLADIRVPALVLNALNDPFVPAASLPAQHAVGAHVTLWQPQHGGHVGFPGGSFPADVLSLPDAVMGWMAQHL